MSWIPLETTRLCVALVSICHGNLLGLVLLLFHCCFLRFNYLRHTKLIYGRTARVRGVYFCLGQIIEGNIINFKILEGHVPSVSVNMTSCAHAQVVWVYPSVRYGHITQVVTLSFG